VAHRSALISHCVSFHLINNFCPIPIIAALDRLWKNYFLMDHFYCNNGYMLLVKRTVFLLELLALVLVGVDNYRMREQGLGVLLHH
jgi:hypothetical protein